MSECQFTVTLWTKGPRSETENITLSWNRTARSLSVVPSNLIGESESHWYSKREVCSCENSYFSSSTDMVCDLLSVAVRQTVPSSLRTYNIFQKVFSGTFLQNKELEDNLSFEALTFVEGRDL